ncbi:MAG: phosphatase PAP2 family protein [Solirubrobacteraceae bacterium]|nr:phosphatase PAP2 family protein [Solirubrobacteraceae bacterium]
MRRSRALRISAWVLVAAGMAAPAVRRRARLPKAAVATAAWSAPVALCVALPRSRKRDIAACLLQMWAYIAMYEMPADDPAALERRVHVDYPVAADRLIGLGELPGVRLQRRFAHPPRLRGPEKLLVWAHWVWFAVPHGTAAYVLLRHRDRFPRAATLIYATFDVGVLFYWILPTAPPWYAALHGRLGGSRPDVDDAPPELRRLMLDYGEQFWRGGWSRLYDGLAGNPLAAMPSLHFATSVTAAQVLREIGPIHGAVGWAYAGTLGTALVYLGEHYVVDLLAGLALAEGVRRAAPRVSPLARAFSRAVRALERAAHGS